MRTPILFCLALAAMTSSSMASWWGAIAIFEDPETMDCSIEVEVDEWSTFYIVVNGAWVYDGGITAVEFGLDNWIGDIPDFPGEIVVTYASPLHIGELGSNFSLAWYYPQTGDWVEILRVDFRCHDLAWVYPGFEIQVRDASESGGIFVVDDDFEVFHAEGTNAVFNCGGDLITIENPYAECRCYDDTRTDSTSWSLVKNLF